MSVYNNSVIIDLCESISRHFQQGEGTFNKEKTLWFACAMHHLRIMCPVKYGHLYQAEERARSPALLTLHHLINIYIHWQHGISGNCYRARMESGHNSISSIFIKFAIVCNTKWAIMSKLVIDFPKVSQQ